MKDPKYVTLKILHCKECPHSITYNSWSHDPIPWTKVKEYWCKKGRKMTDINITHIPDWCPLWQQ